MFTKKKSKQSYVWIDSILEAQNIFFGSETAGLLDHSYNKCALGFRILASCCGSILYYYWSYQIVEKPGESNRLSSGFLGEPSQGGRAGFKIVGCQKLFQYIRMLCPGRFILIESVDRSGTAKIACHCFRRQVIIIGPFHVLLR